MLDNAKNWFRLIDIELKALERYQEKVEGYFWSVAGPASAAIDFAGIDEDGEEITPDPDKLDGWVEEYREFGIEFPNHFRASFLAQMISFIENKLKKTVIFHYDYKTPTFNSDTDEYKFLGDRKIKTYMKYLKDSGDMDFEIVKKEWDLINNLIKIRNVFTHHNGIVRQSDSYCDDIETFINKNPKHVERHKLTSEESSSYLLLLKHPLNQATVKLTRTFFKKLLYDNLKLVVTEVT